MSLEWNLKDILRMDPQEGLISFRGNRLLLFHADALSQLKDELIKTLGFDLARGVLARFGYRCGFSDVQSVKTIFAPESDAEWMLAGPTIHTLEGLVQVTNEVLDFDRGTGHFYMRGRWQNSYEAKEYLNTYGSSLEPVCWTLVGYASGYSSGFMGRDTVCVETKCIAKGDPYCQYEIRSREEWQGKADKYWRDLQPNAVVKSLQHLLSEERERVNQWRVLNEIALSLSKGLDFNEASKEFYQQVCQLLLAEKVLLVINQEHSSEYTTFSYELGASETERKSAGQVSGVLSSLLAKGVPLRLSGEELPDYSFMGRVKDFLGVPLVYNGRQMGSLMAVNKLTGRGFSEDDQTLLALLALQVAIVAQNTKLYRQTDMQLQAKNHELNRVNEYLVKQHRNLQKSAELHHRLTGLVLEDAGLQRIIGTIAQNVGMPVWIEDKEFRILTEARGAKKENHCQTGYILSKCFSETELLNLYSKKQIVVFQGEDNAGNCVRRCLTPIIAGKEVLGFLVVELTDQNLSEEKKLILRDASVVIALEILKQKVLIENKRRFEETLLDEWLFGEVFAEERVVAWTLKLGLTLEYPMSLLAVEFEGEGLGLLNKLVSDSVDSIPAACLLGMRENCLVVLICKDENSRWAESLAKKLAKGLADLSHLRWWLTVGPLSQSIAQTRENYANACAANKIMSYLRKDNTVFLYEKLGVYGMLGLNPERFVWFAKKLLGEVIEYDLKHKTELVPTLKLYFQNNQNIQAAARRGFLNDGTLKYRLKRIQEIARIDLADPEVNLQIQLALKFL